MTLRASPLLVSLAALTGLGACATTPPADLPTGPSAADIHRIDVAQSTSQVDIAVSAQDTGLSDTARTDLRRLAGAYARMGHGPLVLSTPAGGANAQAAARVAQQARILLADTGVPYGAIASSTYDAAGAPAAPIIASFSHFEATAPECAPLWTQDLAHPVDNRPWDSFGCSAAANLAALIEDPRDLLGPREEDPRDGARRDTVMGHYRAGEPTATPRGADEQIRISDAVD